MRTKDWNISVNNHDYEIKLEHYICPNKVIIYINGNKIGFVIKKNNEHRCMFEGHEFYIVRTAGWIKVNYELVVDGIVLSRNLPYLSKKDVEKINWQHMQEKGKHAYYSKALRESAAGTVVYLIFLAIVVRISQPDLPLISAESVLIAVVYLFVFTVTWLYHAAKEWRHYEKEYGRQIDDK
jgi:hypothetical protein